MGGLPPQLCLMSANEAIFLDISSLLNSNHICDIVQNISSFYLLWGISLARSKLAAIFFKTLCIYLELGLWINKDQIIWSKMYSWHFNSFTWTPQCGNVCDHYRSQSSVSFLGYMFWSKALLSAFRTLYWFSVFQISVSVFPTPNYTAFKKTFFKF